MSAFHEELMFAIRRLRAARGEMTPLVLLVPEPLSDAENQVLAAIDVRMVVSKALAGGKAFVMDVYERRYWDIPLGPPLVPPPHGAQRDANKRDREEWIG
jgi:hypothetical protein